MLTIEMAGNSRGRRDEEVRAGALLCPRCCIEYEEVEVDFEYGNTVFPNVKILKCPACEEELFTPTQNEAITKRIEKSELEGIDAGKVVLKNPSKKPA